MAKLEERLEEAYNDLDEVDRQYDEVTQINRKRIDYLIMKRQLICDRIGILDKEVKLDEENEVKEPEETNDMDCLSNVIKSSARVNGYW